ncbi:MAG: pyridoxal-phosphate dependent enzyme [Chromatiales bacterium]|nr:pyridoxal-phosphate dependent enzyme [Chromatiales bacterium]
MLSLSDEEARRGVVTHSSGNHAQALALAARLRGIPARIVMPRTAPAVKVAAVKGYGAEITFCEPTLEARTAAADAIIAATGAVLVHPYDDPRVIAGQGTCALEILDSGEKPDVLLCPVGGGGLTSGTALSARYFGGGAVRVVRRGARGRGRRLPVLHDPNPSCPRRAPGPIADGLLTSLGSSPSPSSWRPYRTSSPSPRNPSSRPCACCGSGASWWWNPPGPSPWPPSWKARARSGARRWP